MSNRMVTTEADAGQTMAEYAVVLSVITLAIVTTFAFLSEAIYDSFMRTVEIVQSVF